MRIGALLALLLTATALSGCSATEGDAAALLATTSSTSTTTADNATATSSSTTTTSASSTTSSSSSSSTTGSATSNTTAPASNSTGNATTTAAPVIVQTLSCDILVGLPVPVRVLGANAPVVGPLPGIGGCLTAALAQDSIVVALNYPAGCFNDIESKVGDDAKKDTAYNIYCDQSVVDTTVSIDFAAA